MARPRNNETRENILRSAYRRFSKYDYEDVLLKDIAAECEITPTLLHHYFPTKADIVVHIIYDLLIKIEEFLVERTPDGSSADRENAAAYDIMSMHLMIDVLVRNNNQLLKMYSYILCDAKLMNQIVDFCFQELRKYGEHYDTAEKRYGQYILFGGISQIVVLYLNGKLLFPITEGVDKLYHGILAAQGMENEHIDELISFANEKITKPVRDLFYETYESSMNHFIYCNW